MTAIAPLPSSSGPDAMPGLDRAARLMQALGPKGAAVWASLTEDEARLISDRMATLPPETQGAADSTLAALLSDMPDATAVGRSAAVANSVWERVETLSPRQLAAHLAHESPQIAAIILSRLSPASAGAAVRALPEDTALQILHRMVSLTTPSARIMTAIELTLGDRLANAADASDGNSKVRVARLLETMGTDAASLLKALQIEDPEAGEDVGALIVAFDDLADFTAPAMQTLIANVERSELAKALKGAPEGVTGAVLKNLTQRARTVLEEEIEALGPLPRRDVETARLAVMDTARALIGHGDIRLGRDDLDDELVE